MEDLRNLLAVSSGRLEEINRFLTDPSNELVNELLAVVERYGRPRKDQS